MVTGVLGKNGCLTTRRTPRLSVRIPPTDSFLRPREREDMENQLRDAWRERRVRPARGARVGPSNGEPGSPSLSELQEDAPEEYGGAGDETREGTGVADMDEQGDGA